MHNWLNDRSHCNDEAIFAELKEMESNIMNGSPEEILTLAEIDIVGTVINSINSFSSSCKSDAKVINSIRRKLDPDQLISACSSCGEIYCMEMDRPRNGRNPCNYKVPLKYCQFLKLSDESKTIYLNLDPNLRKVIFY